MVVYNNQKQPDKQQKYFDEPVYRLENMVVAHLSFHLQYGALVACVNIHVGSG